MVRPHPGEAIGLDLHPHLQLISVGLVHALLQPLHLGQDAEQVLHVMTDLVGNHVGFGELARFAAGVAGVETALEILKERGVEIDLAVVRAVERPHCGLRESAGRACDPGKHHERRRLVGFAVLRKNFLPLRFRAAEHGRDELSHLVRGRSRACLARTGCLTRLLLRTAPARQDVGAADQYVRIYTEPPTEEAEYDDGADAEAAALPTRNAKAPARSVAAILTPSIFDVVAARQLIETHFSLSSHSLRLRRRPTELPPALSLK